MAKRKSEVNKYLESVLKRKKTPWWLAIIIVIILFALTLFDRIDEGGPAVDTSVPGGIYQVERVIDGDTFKLANGERVRLIGVNTPETVDPRRPVERFGPEASAFTKSRLTGKSVRLDFDKERRDRYGRLLAYVYVDDRFLNEELIERGFGHAETQYPYSSAMKKRFRAAEDQAKAAHRGLWGEPLPKFKPR